MTGAGFCIVVVGLFRDGAETWICDLETADGQSIAKNVYVHGKTEEEAFAWLQRNIFFVPRPEVPS